MRFWQATTKTLLRRTPASLMVGFSVILVWPTESLAATVVRFLHAVPSAGTVTVEVTQAGSERSMGAAGFAQVTPWRSIRSGQFEWSLVANGKTLAHGTATLGSGAYDLVLLAKRPETVGLGIYKAQAGRPSTALVRVIHAAPGLGTPQLRVDSKVAVPKLAFGQATPYLSMTPGKHFLSATPPNRMAPLVAANATLTAGTSYSEVVIGSDGRRLRTITLIDRGVSLTRAAAHSVPVAAAESTAGGVTVQPGDSLWQIARDHLGPAASNESIDREYHAIWHLNAAQIGTGDPNLIFPGQHVSFPTT